ncbi:hypothetical protein NPX13_g6311 [Xylaria arbuscula]|uniref:Septation initiation network scaffold protein cdc11 n=1 Tax=Xylaria arbuscula TaxID=114810 RepID=A0A9W8NCH5_9PEZI|nr:hypothetical protein NPX13_g6311 [Xylaria arbuscula]
MAQHAWLDSLSEDWVSQPRSDESQAQLPTPSSPPASTMPEGIRDRSSRIPRLNGANVKLPGHQHLNNSPSVLSERSPNDINIKAAQLKPSRLSQEDKTSTRGRRLSRSSSASTAGSVVHNSVLQSKPHSASPSKGRENEPEWKRRLIYGELDYGETKDLFSSAATGLENIFRPPQSSDVDNGAAPVDAEGYTINETTLPSSPPPYRGSQRSMIADDDDFFEQDSYESSIQHNMSLPQPKIFRSTEDDNAGISSGDAAPSGEDNFDAAEAKLDGEFESSAMFLRREQLLDESRKISGQSDTRNEDFSPIFIARHSSEGGRVSFSPMELPAHQLRNKLEILRRNQMILDPEPDLTSSKPTDASNRAGDAENTEDFARNGGFLNLRRGGRSTDGSFHQRPLSPPINLDTSEMLPESSLQASTPKQFPTIRTNRTTSTGYKDDVTSPQSPPLPRAPHPSPEKRLQPASIKTSSPLKLFGPYDTFTNQTLLRRISQFEDQPSHHNSLLYSADETAESPKVGPNETYNGIAGSSITNPKETTHIEANYQDAPKVANRFGAGELDEYEFGGDISLDSSSQSHYEEKENVAPSPRQPASANAFRFDIHEDMPPEGDPLVVGRTRGKETRSVSSTHGIRVSKSWDGLRSRISTGAGEPNSLFPSVPQRDGSEGKRPRTSPSKDPTPKRRRTLHRSDIAYGVNDWRAGIETVKSSHYTMQSAITRNHNIRQAEIPELVNRNVQSAHQILRPRSPTPNQRVSEHRDRAPLAELNFNPAHEPAKSFMSGHQIEHNGNSASRKASMKTQDFYDAAEEVMAMIRNKARPMTGLASVEESEAESSHRPTHNESMMSEDSFQESTREPFSRPPSRDGRPIVRLPTRQEDPELVNRLKKYEEHGDVDGILSQSLRSMKALQIDGQQPCDSISRDRTSSQMNHVYDGDDIISDIPNVRISRNPDQPESITDPLEFSSHKSQSSSSSTKQSIPTSSSRGSDSRRLIAPDVVAQLIGNQVGNMVFDDVNKMWQKLKAPRPPLNILPSEDSEDDPFASIPDLTVDTIKERRNLDLAVARTEADSSEEPSHDKSLSWSSPKPGTVTEESLNSKHSTPRATQADPEIAVEDDEEIEHEISLHEDRIQKSTPSRPRNLTITFSSPIASIIQDLPQRSFDDDSYSEDSNLGHSLGSIATDSIKGHRPIKLGRSVSAMAARSSSRSRSRGVQKGMSVEGQAFVPRPVSRIDERDEDALPEGHVRDISHKHVSIIEESAIIATGQETMENPELSVVMATPNPERTAAMFGTPVIGQYVGTFSLSPMSEFTIHQVDNSCALEVSYVVGDQYLMTGDGSKKPMSKAVRTLVEKITEVQPFEPEWERVPELDLSNKQLDTFHMLDEFCPQLVTLDASNNKVPHLDGVPQSVRNLRMTHNVLSELTAWRQLLNLQYVDVSNNQIKSLSAFKDLVHLRTLRADNNQITSLDSIKFHDSLQVLRARGNLITHVDLDGTKMNRLTELDLENNQIIAFENSEQLTCLSTLNLQHNCLTSFTVTGRQPSLSLRLLKLSNNELETLDLAALPSLRVLHVDRNNITTITGLSQCHRLDSLSLREQKGYEILDTSFLDSACEVRKLFLSGNRLSGFNPQIDFLNLQYLELANCGLQSLSPHLGQMMPNLRMLNINFNAIDDLWPLRYIPRLKKLLAAGNRLSDARKISSALAEFPHLSRLDLRNNGATLGFYAPVHALVSAEDGGKKAEFDPFTLPDMDVERQEMFAGRLDMDTRMRKRVYDMIVLKDCKQLKMLDGLPVTRDITTKRDDVWKALMGTNIVGAEEKNAADSSEQ